MSLGGIEGPFSGVCFGLSGLKCQGRSISAGFVSRFGIPAPDLTLCPSGLTQGVLLTEGLSHLSERPNGGRFLLSPFQVQMLPVGVRAGHKSGTVITGPFLI